MCQANINVYMETRKLCARAQGATATPTTNKRRLANRKCVIGAVTCAVVVAMIVVGVLVSIKLFTDADLERLRVTYIQHS